MPTKSSSHFPMKGAIGIAPAGFVAGCGSEYAIIPHFPTTEDMVCVPTETSNYSPPANGDRFAGRSVDAITYGNLTTDPNSLRYVAVGASGDEAVSEAGFVRLVDADAGTGLLGTGGETLTPPSGTPQKQFGWAVHGADVYDCFHGTSGTYYDACGEELLIGAPDTASGQTRGGVHWYYALANGNTHFARGGAIVPPLALPAGAEFGYAIASPRVLADETKPWDVAPDVPSWIAISAPGDERVLIYTVSSATPTFTKVLTLVGPDSGRRFGTSLATGDFDGDGIFDLAVGAPNPSGSASEGRVYVYRGQTGTPPLRSTPMVLLGWALTGTTTGGVQDDACGQALAAGRFVGDYDRDAIAIGAPNNDWDTPTSGPSRLQQGAVCTVVLQAATGASGLSKVSGVGGCATNPWTQSSNTTDEQFGRALAVGNYVNADGNGVSDNAEATLSEVAISRPGWSAATGEVAVFLTGSAGLDLTSLGAVIQQYPGTVSGARFGDSVNDGFVQESGWEDLMVGSPYDTTGANFDGGATLTQAIDTSSCTEIHGTWQADDVNSVARDIKIWTDPDAHTHLTFLDDFAVELHDSGGTGSLCEVTWDSESSDVTFDLVAGTDLDLGNPWSCGSGNTQTWVDVDGTVFLTAVLESMGVELPPELVALAGDQLMDVTIEYDGSTHIDLDFDLDNLSWGVANTAVGLDEECRPTGLPWGLDQTIAGVCE